MLLYLSSGNFDMLPEDCKERVTALDFERLQIACNGVEILDLETLLFRNCPLYFINKFIGTLAKNFSFFSKSANAKISYALIAGVTLFALSVAIPVFVLTISTGFPLMVIAPFGFIFGLIGIQCIYAQRKQRVIENKNISWRFSQLIFDKYTRAFWYCLHE